MMQKGNLLLKIIILLLIANLLAIGILAGSEVFIKSRAEYQALDTWLAQQKPVLTADWQRLLAAAPARAGAEQLLKAAMEEPDVLAMAVRLAGGQWFGGKVKDPAGKSRDITSAEHYSLLLGSTLNDVYKRAHYKLVTAGGDALGSIELFITAQARQSAIRHYTFSRLIQAVLQALISLVLILPGIYFIVIRPIRTIAKKTEELTLKQGDLTQGLTIRSQDEIGQLARFLNNFITALNEQLCQINESSLNLNHSIDELSETSHKIASTSSHQAAAVKEIVTTMEDSDKLTKSIAAGSHEVVELSQSSKQSVQEGFAIIQLNQQKMDEIKITNAKVLTQIRHLDESIKNISKILSIITSIADQTKIIAFNAELEAFQAGAAGKNFEIVANEIRRLADNTIHSTREIQKSLEEIQNAAKHLNLSSEESAEKISEGWQLAGKVEKLFDNILHSAEISSQAAAKINLSINQNSAALEQIFITLKQLAAGVAEIADTTQAMDTSSIDIKQMISDLEQIIRHYHLKSPTNQA